MYRERVHYLPPVGEEFQHEEIERADGVVNISYHDDSWVLKKMDEGRIDASLSDAIRSRLQEFAPEFSTDVREVLDKLNDDQLIDVQDASRYAQFESDKKNKLISIMKQIDSELKQKSEEEQSKKYESYRDKMFKYYERLNIE